MHREAAAGSARLHLFQELSTLGQQLAHPLLLGSDLGRIEAVLPARTPLGRARSGTGMPVHTKCTHSDSPLSCSARPRRLGLLRIDGY